MEILAKSVGRRKEAVAQIKIIKGTGQFIINNKPAQEYLQNDSCSLLSVKAPFDILLASRLSSLGGVQAEEKQAEISPESQLNIDTIVKVKGGGLMGQAEAIRLGLARAFCLLSLSPGFGSSRSSEATSSSNTLDNSAQTYDDTQALSGFHPDDAQKVGERANSSEANNDLSISVSTAVDIRKQLKDKGYLTQDSRVKERRKYGLKKARKASQYHKR